MDKKVLLSIMALAGSYLSYQKMHMLQSPHNDEITYIAPAAAPVPVSQVSTTSPLDRSSSPPPAAAPDRPHYGLDDAVNGGH
jgi:hypothetical protein